MPTAPTDQLVDERYRLERVVRQDDLGAVWRATDERRRRTVAVRILDVDGVAVDELQSRLEETGRALVGLRHPLIVPVLSYGMAGRSPYIVMHSIGGEALTSAVARAPLPPTEIRALLAPVGEALAAAHGRGVAHGRLTPAAVLVEGGRSRVLDLGLMTIRGHGPLNPDEYLAPEQAAGEAAGPEADLYALGTLVFVLATGQAAAAESAAKAGSATRRLVAAAPGLGAADPALCALCDSLRAVRPGARPTAREATDRLLDGREPAWLDVAGPESAIEERPRRRLTARMALPLIGLLLIGFWTVWLIRTALKDTGSARRPAAATAPDTGATRGGGPTSTARTGTLPTPNAGTAPSGPSGSTAVTAPARSTTAAPAGQLGRFPSKTCTFDAPVGWVVVWSDLDRGEIWHNEARPAAKAVTSVSCDVSKGSVVEPAQAAALRRAVLSKQPAYHELAFGERPRASGGTMWVLEYESVAGTGTPLHIRTAFVGTGQIVAQAPTGDFDRLSPTFDAVVASTAT